MFYPETTGRSLEDIDRYFEGKPGIIVAWDKGEFYILTWESCHRRQASSSRLTRNRLTTEATSVKRPEIFTRMDAEIANEKLGDEEVTSEKVGEEPRVEHI